MKQYVFITSNSLASDFSIDHSTILKETLDMMKELDVREFNPILVSDTGQGPAQAYMYNRRESFKVLERCAPDVWSGIVRRARSQGEKAVEELFNPSWYEETARLLSEVMGSEVLAAHK